MRGDEDEEAGVVIGGKRREDGRVEEVQGEGREGEMRRWRWGREEQEQQSRLLRQSGHRVVSWILIG